MKWGAYTKADPTEEQAIVTTVQAALGGGVGGGQALITKRFAVQKLASVFGIENVDALLEELEEEAQAKADEEAQRNADQLAQMHALVGNGKPGAGSERVAPPQGSGATRVIPGAASAKTKKSGQAKRTGKSAPSGG